MLGYHTRLARRPPPWQGDPLPGKETPCLGKDTPRGQETPRTVHAGRYGQQAGGMHPTGMQSCFKFKTFIFFSLQQLKQENHELRMRSETIESEYEMTVKELQNDVTTLRHQMDDQQTHQMQGDRTRSQIVHELTQQNERLTEQLKKVSSDFLSLSAITVSLPFRGLKSLFGLLVQVTIDSSHALRLQCDQRCLQ